MEAIDSGRPSDYRRTAKLHPLVENLAVIVLSLIAIAFSVSDIVVPWHPYGVVGFVVSPNGTIVHVVPHSDVQKAGIHVGDHISAESRSIVDAFAFTGSTFAGSVNSRYTFIVVTPGGTRRSVMVGVEKPTRTSADNITDVIQCLSYFISIGMAAALVIVRRSGATWAFFLFVVLSIGVAVTPGTLNLPVISFIEGVISSLTLLGWIPLTIFAIRFPNDSPNTFGRNVERVLLASLIVLLPAVFCLPASILIGHPVPKAVFGAVARIDQLLPQFGLVLATAMFAAAYRAANPSDRTRMQWVIAGFVAGYSGFVVLRIPSVQSQTFTGLLWVHNLLAAAPVFATIAVTYAIFRHRVFDIRIVVRRAAIYALLTTIVVALIALMDFFVGKVFEGTKIAAFGEIGIAVALGVVLNPLHRRLEKAVDSAIFRRRRLGERRLRLIADGLIHANASTTISSLIVNESMDAFGLASVAVFEADRSGDYALTQSAGWETAACDIIDHESSLVLMLIASGSPMRLTARDVAALAGAPDDVKTPGLAVPIVFRGELDGFVLFGAHVDGDEIDAEELESLWTLTRAAASAYDHLDAQAMRAELSALKSGKTAV